MIIDVYGIICWIVLLCVLGLVVLICWPFELIFKKLNLAATSDFFYAIRLLLIFFLILGVFVIVFASAAAGFYFIITHIANFLFALF